MPKLIVTTREGETSEIDVADGLTVMEAIRDNGFDELLALCDDLETRQRRRHTVRRAAQTSALAALTAAASEALAVTSIIASSAPRRAMMSISPTDALKRRASTR